MIEVKRNEISETCNLIGPVKSVKNYISEGRIQRHMSFINHESKMLLNPYTDGKLNELGKKYHSAGIEALKSKKLGVVILSGGQGTRLGSTEPKGLYQILGKSLIEWHLLAIKKLIINYGADITVYIMTSSFTEEAVKKYISENDFGVKITTFVQNNAVCEDMSGNPLKYYDGYAEAPNGNGSIFKSITQVPFEELEAINVISVDNVLANILDPVFVGAFFSNKLEILSKSVTKEAGESVGAFTYDGKLRIKEYSESKSDGTGIQGNICNHLFSTSFIKKMSKIDLPEHKAVKKIPHTVDNCLVQPEKPNGIKKETFIFDSFEYSSRNMAMNVPRNLEFSPLKNGLDSTIDNPTTCALAVQTYRICEKE